MFVFKLKQGDIYCHYDKAVKLQKDVRNYPNRNRKNRFVHFSASAFLRKSRICNKVFRYLITCLQISRMKQVFISFKINVGITSKPHSKCRVALCVCYVNVVMLLASS